MVDARKKDINWNVANVKGEVTLWEQATVAVLMDLRDELKRLNALLHCHNFTMMPHVLQRIDKRLAKKIPLR